MRSIQVGDSDSVIPPAQQRRALKIINDVNRHVQAMRRFDRRINNLFLFNDYVHPAGHPLSMSVQEYKDHPVVQLLLERRDRYRKLEKEIAAYQVIVDDFSPEGKHEQALKVQAIAALSRLKVQQSHELEAMEVALINIRKELVVHLHTCQKFVTDMVKISQLERLLMHKIGGSTSDLTDDVLDAKLADDV